MAFGILGKGLAGLGGGMAQAGLMAFRSHLEEARDARLAQYQGERDQRVFEQQGAMQERGFEQQERSFAARAERERENIGTRAEAEKELLRERMGGEGELLSKRQAFEREESAKDRSLRGAAIGVQREELGMRKREFGLKERIAEMELANAETIKDLKSEFRTATPERKNQIADELNILRGGNVNENWIVSKVQTGVDDFGQPIYDYIKVSKRTGEEMPLGLGRRGGNAPSNVGSMPQRPALESFFMEPAPTPPPIRKDTPQSKSGKIRIGE